jgi:hypothetical protein
MAVHILIVATLSLFSVCTTDNLHDIGVVVKPKCTVLGCEGNIEGFCLIISFDQSPVKDFKQFMC